MRVIDRNSDLHFVAPGGSNKDEVGEDEGIAYVPASGGPLVLTLEQPVLAEAVVELLKTNSDVVLAHTLGLLTFCRVVNPKPFLHVFPQIAMKILNMDRVHRVLLALEPVAGNGCNPDLAECV